VSKVTIPPSSLTAFAPQLTARLALVTALVLLVLATSGCSRNRVTYIGDSLTPTSEVDVFFNARDIERNYRVMGRATGVVSEGGNVDRLNEKFIDTARTKGADGVIFGDMVRRQAGSTTGSVNVFRAIWNFLVGVGGSQTRASFEYEVRAEFIKYRNGP